MFKGLPSFDISQPDRKHALVNPNSVWSMPETILGTQRGAPGELIGGKIGAKGPPGRMQDHCSARAGLGQE